MGFMLVFSVSFLAAFSSVGSDFISWKVFWPFSQDVTTVHDQVCRGYGDWTPWQQGPHDGLDFAPSGRGDITYVPTNDPAGRFVLYYGVDQGWDISVCFGKLVASTHGWWMAHVDADAELFQQGNQVDPFLEIGGCVAPETDTYQLHVHMEWRQCVGGPVGPQYYNPRDHFDPIYTAEPDGPFLSQDEVRFKPVFFEEALCMNNRGILFIPDFCEVLDECIEEGTCVFEGWPQDIQDLQDNVWGTVDMAASPTSYQLYPDMAESERYDVGVYEVGYRLKWQDPGNPLGTYDPIPLNSSGTSVVRILVRMSGQLPWVEDDQPRYTDEYGSVFLDGDYGRSVTLIDGFHPFTNSEGETVYGDQNTAYVITNCGEDLPGSDGWDNLYHSPEQWLAACDNNWPGGPYCEGGWDTRLHSPSDEPPCPDEHAQVNEHAYFPDGRYCVEVSATSHMSRDYQTLDLPREDVLLGESSPLLGIVVDNYLPHVDSVIVYSLDGDEFELHYTRGWDTDKDDPLVTPRTENVGEDLSYIPKSGRSVVLGIAVRYSEPLQEVNDRIWLETRTPTERTWDSREDSTDFLQVDMSNWPAELGTPPQEPREGGFHWRLYERRYGELLEGYYGGELFLKIGSYPDSLEAHFPGPLDLAGSTIDGSPATAAHPRSGSQWGTPQGYDPAPYISSWGGNPTWNKSPEDDFAYARTEDCGLVAELDLAQFELEHTYMEPPMYTGWDYPDMCGFWTAYHPVDASDSCYYYYVIEPDGENYGAVIRTLYPYNGDLWTTGRSEETDRELTSTGCYMWSTWLDSDRSETSRVGYSAASVACVSAPDASLWTHTLVTGTADPDAVCFAYIEELLPNEGVRVHVARGSRHWTEDYWPPDGGPVAGVVGEPERPTQPYEPTLSRFLSCSNPQRSVIQVVARGMAGETVAFSIYDLTGRLLCTERLQLCQAREEINPDLRLPPGLYIAVLEPMQGPAEMLRIVLLK